MHWILILTIYSPCGISIESVGPFVNKGNCYKAGNAWVMDQLKRKNSDSKYLSAICVQK